MSTTDDQKVVETVPTYYWKLIAAVNLKKAILIVTINDSSRGKADRKFGHVDSPCVESCELYGIGGLNMKTSNIDETLTYCCNPKTLIDMGYNTKRLRGINLEQYETFENLGIVVERRWGW